MSYKIKYMQANEDIKKAHDEQEVRIDSAFKEVDGKDRKTMMEKGWIGNANNATETGIYVTNANTTNRPSSSTYGGVLVTLNRDERTLVQIHIDIVSAKQMTRVRPSGGVWGSWV